MANRSVRTLAGSSKTDKNDPFARDGDGKLVRRNYRLGL